MISEEDLEAMFGHPNFIDLYSIVTKMTDWPLGSYGIKAIAQYLSSNGGMKPRPELSRSNGTMSSLIPRMMLC